MRRRPQVSFGTIGLSVGVTLLLAGFLGYFNFIKISDNSLSALLLIYGFPISLIGAARPCTLSASARPADTRPARPQASRSSTPS